MTVVDASVLVAATADAGSDGQWAEQIVSRGDLAAPHRVLAEAANILRRLELGGKLTRPQAQAAHGDLLSLELHLLPYDPFAERVWALRSNVTSYDAWYVAIAEALKQPLATLDRRLVEATGPECGFEVPP